MCIHMCIYMYAMGGTRARTMSAQGGTDLGGPKGPGGPTRAQGGSQWPRGTHTGPGEPTGAQGDPQGPGPRGPLWAQPTRAQGH